MSFWKSGSDRYQARHVNQEGTHFDLLAGIFNRRNRTHAVVISVIGLFGLGSTLVFHADEKPKTPHAARAYSPDIKPEDNRHIRVGRGVLERCNNTVLPVTPPKHHRRPVKLHTSHNAELTNTHINREKLLHEVQPALVSLEQPTGIDAATGKMRVNRWSGVVVKDPTGRKRSGVVSVGHGLVDGDAPITITDAAGRQATVTDGCYIYQAKNKALPIPTYGTTETASAQHRKTADIDLGIFYVDGPIGESALEIAAHEPVRGDFALFANHPHGEQEASAFTALTTSVHEPSIEYITGIDAAQEAGGSATNITPQLGSSGGAVVNGEGKIIGISYGMSGVLTPEQVTSYCGVESDQPLPSPVLAVTISSDMIVSTFDALQQDHIPLLAAHQ
ncbi:MAG TPA: trypsin-like peptidase domain-containing protein [Candidatus Saccharimonadales bacterium]|nr:trypsin-like peptidase domain-containing protein [Candidatus Saccharimonadales bacterium]